MNCSFCNATITRDDLSCPACGAPIKLDDVIPPPSPYYTETVVEAAPQPLPPVVEGLPRQSTPITIPVTEINTLLQDRSYWAVASLVLGVIGLFSTFIPGICGFITSVPAIVLGAMSLKSRKRKFAIAGMVLGIVSIVIGLISRWYFLVL